MTLTLDLPGDVTRKMEEAAAQRGMPLSEFAAEFLASHFVPRADTAASRSGAEILAIWQKEGLLGEGPDIEDPVAFARELRERNQRRIHD